MLSDASCQTNTIALQDVGIQAVDDNAQANIDVQSLRTLRGKWEPVWETTTLRPNDVLRAKSRCLSADAVPVQLEAKHMATVRHFDADGDAHMYVPELASVGAKTEVIVFAYD